MSKGLTVQIVPDGRICYVVFLVPYAEYHIAVGMLEVSLN